MHQDTRLQRQQEEAMRIYNETYGKNTSEETPSSESQSNTTVLHEEAPEPKTIETPQNDQFTQETSIDWEARAKAAEQRYKVLQGKYNKEVVEVRSSEGQPQADNLEVMKLKQQIESLQQTITQMQAKPEPEQPQHYQFSERAEQVREDYGEELFDTILDEADRRAQERAQQQMQQMQQSLSTVQQDSFATKKALLAQRLAGQSINFEQVNNDPVFHDWLKLYDPQTGVQRQTRLSQSFESGDLNTVSSMFVEFVNGAQNPTQSVDFTEHVQQATHAPTPTSDPQSRPIYTPQMISDFYARKRRGEYSEDEAQRIEREIFQAIKQR